MGWGKNDDPRKLRDLLGKAAMLASEHSLSSMVVGSRPRRATSCFPRS